MRRVSIALVTLAGLLGVLAAFGADPAYADGFWVTSPASDIRSDCEKQDPILDTCTFEDALRDANANTNDSTINFDLDSVTAGQTQPIDPGPGLFFDLLTLDQTTTIDGFTQQVDDLPPGTPPIALINSTMGISSAADGSVIRGLLLGGRPGTPSDYNGIIQINTEGVRIEGNWIGVGKLGTATGAPASVACGGCTDVVIGGPDQEDRNVLSGNSGWGVKLVGASNVTVSGNYVGLAPDGTVAGNRLGGVLIDDSTGVTVGGATPVEANVISGNGPSDPPTFGEPIGHGVSIFNSSNVLLQRNLIGTNPAGTVAHPNTGHGVRVQDYEQASRDIAVGTPGHGNLISGNGSATPGSGVGVLLLGETSQSVLGQPEVEVQGNRIGTTANGTGSIPNRLDGVRAWVTESRITVGGSAPLAGNTIANSQTGFGVNVLGNPLGTAQEVRPDAVEILGNSVYDNAELGISLGGEENPRANDEAAPPYDTDIGPNYLQNYPVLDRAASNGIETTVSGELRTTPGTFRVEVFSNPSCDPSGNGEGRTFLGAFELASGGSGEMAFTRTLPNPIPGDHSAITATATNTVGTPGKTSEFSRCLAPTPGTNSPPEAADDQYATNQGDILALVAPGVLSNDTIPGGGPLTVAAPRPLSGPTNGTLTLNADGSFAYAPDAGFSGDDSFTYKASGAGEVSNAATVTITVRDATPPPAPTITGPADDAFDTDGAITLSGTAEADSTVRIFEGAALRGTTTANPGGAWSMTLDGVSDGPHTYRARATDAADNTSGFSNTRTVVVDTTKPSVRTTSPAAGVRNVPAGANVIATFSEAMRPGTVNAGTVTLVKKGTTRKISARVSYSASKKQAVLNPSTNLSPGATYTATVTTGTRDAAGNALARNKAWTFTARR